MLPHLKPENIFNTPTKRVFDVNFLIKEFLKIIPKQFFKKYSNIYKNKYDSIPFDCTNKYSFISQRSYSRNTISWLELASVLVAKKCLFYFLFQRYPGKEEFQNFKTKQKELWINNYSKLNELSPNIFKNGKQYPYHIPLKMAILYIYLNKPIGYAGKSSIIQETN